MTVPFAWSPEPGDAVNCNVARFMKTLGIANVSELRERSTADVAWFWDAIVKALPIEFFKPYDAVLDDSRGIAWTRWFVGGELNLCYNCVDRHALFGKRQHAAIVWEGEDGAVLKVTYGDLHAETCRLANALMHLGVGKGDRVGIFLPMLSETVVALMAVARIGAIAIPIFSGFGASAVAVRLEDGAAKVLITADGFLRKGQVVPMKQTADEAVSRVESVRHTIVVRRIGDGVPWREGVDLDWNSLLAREQPTGRAESLDSETPFMIAYTSGTTGKPKGSVHVHGGFLVKIAQEVAHQVDMTERDILYWFTDMGWIMGPWEVVGGLALGGTIFLYEGSPDWPAPDRIWRQIEQHRVSILGLSPTLIRALMRHGDEPPKGHELSSLRILGSTGEPWNPDPWRWYFEKIGGGHRPLINFSGGTEVGACFLSPFPCEAIKPCSVGGASLGMAIDVFDGDGKPIRDGVGELVCTKPWPAMTRGLWNDAADRYTETYWQRWPDIWLHGDWASIDDDGRWFLHGRSDDTIKIAGKRLGPAEIESVLVEHPGVVEAAAIGVPDELKGELVWCFAVLRPGFEGSDELRADLRGRVAAALGKSFAPEQVRFVSELPKTRSGKIMRRGLRAKVLGQDAGDLSTLDNPKALEEAERER